MIILFSTMLFLVFKKKFPVKFFALKVIQLFLLLLMIIL